MLKLPFSCFHSSNLPPRFVHFLSPLFPLMTLCFVLTPRYSSLPPLSLRRMLQSFPLLLFLAPSFNTVFELCRRCPFHLPAPSSSSSPHSLPCFIIHLSSLLSPPATSQWPYNIPPPLYIALLHSKSFTSHSLYLSFLLSSPSNAFSFFSFRLSIPTSYPAVSPPEI